MLAALTLLAALLAAAPHADAHATANPRAALAGSYFATGFRIGHGCNGTATTAVTVQIAEGVTSVKPRGVQGWKVSTTKRAVDPPMTAYGKTINETLDTVTWTARDNGSALPDAMFEDFELSMKLPALAEGDGDVKTIFFPVTQQCVQGVWYWTALPHGDDHAGGSKDAESNVGPAPVVLIANDQAVVLGVNKTESQQQQQQQTSGAISIDGNTQLGVLLAGTAAVFSLF